MIESKSTIFDGFNALPRGVHMGKAPTLLGEQQCREAKNLSFRGGEPTVRPGYARWNLVFETGTNADAFLHGNFQGAKFYDSPQGSPQVIASISGRIYRLLLSTYKREASVRDMTPGGLPNAARRPHAWMVQAEEWFVIQDGQSAPILYNGGIMRRATQKEIPVGEDMAYGQGRIWMIRNKGVVAGDLVGSSTDAVIKFTETTYLNEGGDFRLPSTMGRPRALFFIPQQDTTTGTGELMIGATDGVATILASQPRPQWKDIPRLETTALLGAGIMGHNAFAIINGDAWHRAQDGWRTYRQARAEIGGWSRLPQSTEVAFFTEADTPYLLEHGTAIYFDNRLLVAVTPRQQNQYVWHEAILSLDFHILSAFGQADGPSWEGLWTGLKPLQFVEVRTNGTQRALCFCRQENDDGTWQVGLSEILREGEDSADEEPPVWSLTTRSHNFGTAFSQKELIGGDAWFTGIRGDVLGVARYCVDQRPTWTSWAEFRVSGSAPACDMGAGTCIAPSAVYPEPESSPRKRFPQPPTCRHFYDIQANLTGTGRCKISRFRLHASTLLEDPAADADCPTPCPSLSADTALLFPAP